MHLRNLSKGLNKHINLNAGIAISTVILVSLPAILISLYASGLLKRAASCNLILLNQSSPCYLSYITWLVLSVAVALTTGILALVDFKTRKTFLSLAIGGSLLVTAVYDLHSLLAEILLMQPVAEDYFYMRWFISRSLLTFLMITSVAGRSVWQRRSMTGNHILQLLSFYIAVLIITIYLSPVFNTVSNIKNSGSDISSPYELVFFILYGLIAILLYKSHIRTKSTVLEKTVALSFLPAMLAQLAMATHSSPFDVYFNSAYYLRLVSFTLPLCGICIEHIQSTLLKKKIIRQLHKEIIARSLTQHRLEEREKQLALTQFHLREKIAALHDSNINLEKFAYTASHDMQEPLRKIRAFGDLLIKNHSQQLSEKGIDYIDRMNNAAKRMQTMIDSLLSYSQAKNAKPSFALISVQNVIKDVLTDLEYLIDKKKAIIQVEANASIRAIPSQLHHLILNLISNALKFQKEGDIPRISIQAYIGSPERSAHPLLQTHFCVLKISDNGIGFDNTDAGRIFNLFYRLNPRTEYEGSGIGLSIVKKIVDNHKGMVEAEGIDGKGATFTVYLPI